ncbi:MAG: hypothetical protein US98_C0001G0014 [Parcubacteria group bacterium GW2011_GWC1_38_6]|uniref:GtrA/DPMS transmembrane domain-containing protein n=1 Tax=Candidatus Zambryskibacteria bacterium RIFCSPHIGHO2_01_FULL_46_25 TaxID=1802738 RepID=A0A1G2SZR8_9BACT|nr:MAG: hypothetical protein US98_C0001G0014 [Parcubacteria group bacterium GW2011_GWC1_38_6]OHA90540.1 MAG: hypothetical protein A2838_01010 [Candidatus Zambryskibacteria bacterium RIFCSPHIGHO2_01_FULL_46_25]
MSPDTDTFFKRTKRLFFDKKFLHYLWTSIFISVLNIVFLYVFIDILGIPTIISSTAVIGSTFIIRYILFDFFKVL